MEAAHLSFDLVGEIKMLLPRGYHVLITSDVSPCIAVKEFLRLGVNLPVFPDSCSSGFTGVESLSDLIDGDPAESMRLGKQDNPSLWQARRPSVGGGRQGGCV